MAKNTRRSQKPRPEEEDDDTPVYLGTFKKEPREPEKVPLVGEAVRSDRRGRARKRPLEDDYPGPACAALPEHIIARHGEWHEVEERTYTRVVKMGASHLRP